MLKSLTINNIVLIDKAEINFSSGLCILSGETGSGKSILLDALGLAIGFRSNLRLIGNDETKAQVVAEFDISKNQSCKDLLFSQDLLDGDSLRIRRTIAENSASKVFVNDVTIGVNLLAQIGETLVEIHGQHDQRGLLNPSFHLAILDEFSGNETLLKNLKKIYENLKNIDEKISDLQNKKEQAQREKDYYEHVVSELKAAHIKDGEQEELVMQKDQFLGKERILKFLSELKTHLSEANSSMILAQRVALRSQNIINNFLANHQEDFEELNEKIDKSTSDLDTAISSFEAIMRQTASSENNLDEIEERLFFIRSLARKYNVQIADLPQVISDAEEKLKLIFGAQESELKFEKEREKLLSEYKKIAADLSAKRKKSALILSKKVEEELKFLKMDGVKFLVQLTTNNSPLITPHGYDKASFTASINKNNFDDIAKIASGGELSRFMLALKVALMNVKSAPTMIFDEIDSGIGGSTADAVGKRLKALAQNLQILVVTHQPQIASKADLHFKISKISADKKIKTMIEKLSNQDREKEIARMLSGAKVSNEAIAAAKSLIAN